MIAGIMPQITLADSGDVAFEAVQGYDIATVRYIFSDGTYKFANIEGDASTGYNYTLQEEDSDLKVTGEYTQDDTYSLPESSDSVVVVAEYFNTEKWDGAVDISWYDPDEDVFYLSTPAQLAGLAAIVNGAVDANTADYRIKGDQSLLVQEKNESASFIQVSDAICYYGVAENSFAGKTVYLTADMDMGGTYTENMIPDEDVVGGEFPIDWDTEVVDGATDVNEAVNWTPIGGLFVLDTDETGDDPKLVESSFNGVLDGQGHRIYNLYCNRYSSKGFSYSQGVGFIGSIGAMYSGQETPEQEPAVRNLSVDGYVLGRRLVGGIVGNVGGTVGDADDDTYAENPDVYIENCANYANVFSTDSKGAGGIVAGGWGTGHIYNCYNTGSISSIYSSAPIGGICASNSGMDVYNCYNTGTISSVNSERARAIGSDDTGTYTVDDCYYLEGCDGGYGYSGWYMSSTNTTSSADCTELTEEVMKSSSFVDMLNNNGKAYVYNEGGYPQLAWEAGGGGQYNVTVENPTTDDGETVTVSITYSVSGTNTGTCSQIIYLDYENTQGYAFRAFTANGETLSGSHYTVGEDTVISAAWEEKVPGVLKAPESDLYSLEMSKDGYQEVDGVLTYVEDVTIYENEQLYEGDVIYVQATLAEDVTPSDINYVYDTDGANPYEYYFTYIDGSGSSEVIVEQTSSLYGYHEVSSTISQDGVYLEITVVPATVHKDWTQIYDESWYENAKSSYAAASEFEISGALELAAFRKLVNEGYDFSGKTVYLTADISLSNQAEGDGSGIRWWKGIGDTTTANDTEDQIPFSGTFDGQGYSITDMTAVNEGTYSGLFSYTKDAVIKNLTVEGRVEAVGYLGGIVGRGENTVIENCVNYAKVTGTTGSSGTYTAYAGGIAGYLEGESSVAGCSNYGVITDSNGVGGIAGYISGTTQITDCLNAGSVVGMGTGTNGVGGIVGHSVSGTIERCANYGMVSSSASYTGGIAGTSTGTRTSLTTIEDCFNAARVRSSSTSSSLAGLGGITGYGNYFNISNCFNYGDITDVSGSLKNTGAVIGRASSNTQNEITNTYYLDSTCEYSVAGQLVSDTFPAASADSTMFADGTILSYINVNGSFVQQEDAAYPELDGLTAENSEAILTVYVRYGYGENIEVRTYSLRELLSIASTYPLGIYQYGTSSFVASDTYATIDDIVYDAGLTFSEGDSLEVAQVGDPYSVTWEDLQRCSYYILDDTAYETANAIIIDWGQSQAGLEETLNNIQSYKDNPSLRFGMGSDPEDEDTQKSGYRLVSGVKTLVIVHPPELSATPYEGSIVLSWDNAEDATGYELLKLNDESGEWEVIFESEEETFYTDSDLEGCENTYSYKIRVYSGSEYMESDVITALASSHTITVHEQQDATCIGDGQEAYYECTVCGKIFSDEGCQNEIEEPVSIPATGDHAWDDGVITEEAADYESTGIKTYTCTVCGETKTEEYTFINGEVSDGAYKAIIWAAENGISQGYSTGADAGTFGVGKTVTREEMVIFIYRLAELTGVDTSESADIEFSDADEIISDGGKKAIAWAVAAGIVKGYDDGTFRPQDECSREEIAVFLYRLAGRPAADTAVLSAFSDSDEISSTGAGKSIAWAYSEGIIKGYTDSDEFGPTDSCLREQFAVMMYRYAKYAD